MIIRLIHQALVGNRELKILEQDVQITWNALDGGSSGIPGCYEKFE
jgi:hypothetical protein